MAIIGQQLDAGATLPEMTWNLLDGSSFNFTTDLKPRWAVVIILRGDW